MWQVSFKVPEQYVAAVQDVLSLVVESSSVYVSEDLEVAEVRGYSQGLIEMADVERVLASVADACGFTMPVIEVEQLPELDWVAENQKSFQPIHAGCFFIYPSHYDGEKPQDSYALQIDAATAFGTGTHETTQGCLQAIDWLDQHVGSDSFKTLLDMGCGTGILAMAMAKIWDRKVMASDIDPESVRVTQCNAELNGVADRLSVVESVGYAHSDILAAGLYDLIVSNILAEPLCEMAPDVKNHLAERGWVVLSGLLNSQAEQVLAAHQAEGLSLIETFVLGEWSTLILCEKE